MPAGLDRARGRTGRCARGRRANFARSRRAPVPRCLVIAWRVSFDSSESCEMEHGSPEHSLATRARRVLSPSAANTRARAFGLAVMRLRILCDMALDILHLFGPAAVVPAECFGAPVGGNAVEAGLGEYEQCTSRNRFQPKFDKGAGSVGVVGRLAGLLEGLDVGPGEGEEAFGFHLFDARFPGDVFVAGIGDLAAGDLAGDEGAVELDLEPLAKLAIVGESPPDAGNRGFEFDALSRFCRTP